MATKKDEIMTDGLTIKAVEKSEENKGPTVRIFLPELEEEGNGIKVDQYEHVTIANEEKEKIYYIHRGEWVDVPVDVFVILKQGRYPKL